MTSRSDEDGLSLIELIVYVVVLGVILIGLSVMLVNMWNTQADVDAQTKATTNGQFVSSEIERAMRNSTGFQVLDGGSTLLVQTSLSSASLRCQSFHYDPTGGVDGTGTLQFSASAAPAPAATSGYAWQKGVVAYVDGSFNKFFTYVDAAGAPTLNGVGIHYSFTAKAADPKTTAGTVTFVGTAYPRNATLEGVSTCWP